MRTLAPLSIAPDVVFHKHRHSALVGSGLPVWLTERGIRRLIVSGIRTEQCCETTTRHASDLGFEVDFVSEATLTFAMTARDGRVCSAGRNQRAHRARARRPLRAHRDGRAGARRRDRRGSPRERPARGGFRSCVIVPPRALLLDIAGPIEVLRRANLEQHDGAFRRALRRRRRARSRARSASRWPASTPLPDALEDDAMIVVPGNADSGRVRRRRARCGRRTRRSRDRRLARARMSARSHTLVSICSGALLAARAGLLDGRECTTHFSVCAELATLAPRARVLENRLYVADGNALQQRRRHGRHRSDAASRRAALQPGGRARGRAASRGVSAPQRRRSAAFAVARRTQPHPSGRASRAGCDRGGSLARVDARGARAHREHEPAASVAPVQRARRHGPAGLHQSSARLARARAARADAARHGTRRRTQRLRAPRASCGARGAVRMRRRRMRRVRRHAPSDASDRR